ncbi:MAG: Ldh family oxidoreductase [Sediminibacterium sp.]|nr:Ldh family oxidoreductase [Sediminibacterium sp.]
MLAFTESIFIKMGCSIENAQKSAQALISADLRGIDSHGVARLNGYVRLWENGRLKTNPNCVIEHETPSTAVLNGDSGVGLLVAQEAMHIAIKKASKVGTGWVAVNNSNHFGIAGFHAMLALQNDMIGIAMTNASAIVSPTYSKEKRLGTNPIAMAIPAGKEKPFIADFATTTASNGKLEILQRLNKKTPAGWVQDELGNPSKDAHILKKGGAMLPLGSNKEHGSHKGYALGSMVDILSGVLSGGNYGPWVAPFPAYIPIPKNQPNKGVGHFLGAMRIDAFQSKENFKKNMDKWIKSMKNAAPINAQNQVLIPGDMERQYEIERIKNGIPLLEEITIQLNILAERFNLTKL